MHPKITVAAALRAYGGSQSALARALGVHRCAVYQWRVRGLRHIPPLRAYELARLKPELLNR